MNNSLVSVIVPTYKRKPKLISRSVESILKQTHSNIELIIVDDSPDDYKYREKVKKYIESLNDPRIYYIQHTKNFGANKARNTGIDIARGEFCAFLDDDDEWIEDKIELQLREFNTSEVALVYCKAVVINESNDTVRPMINSIKQGYYYEELLRQNFIGSNSYVIIKTGILKEVGKYDETLTSNQDYDLFLRIAKRHKISGVNKVLVKYYNHDGERITKNPGKQLQGRLGLYKKHYRDIIKINNLKQVWEIKNIPLYYRIGDKRRAIKLATKLFFKKPIFFLKYLKGTLDYKKKLRSTTIKKS